LSIKLYTDVHVPYAITLGLRLRDVDVLTAQDDATTVMSDVDLLDRATSLGRALFTQDHDFLSIVRDLQQRGRPFAGIVYAHQADVTIGQCVNDLELIAKAYEPEDIANRVEYLPL
jgi:predicted nuclease of predicted toxin-antitoxin system